VETDKVKKSKGRKMKYLLASLLSIMLSQSVLSEEDEQLLYKCTVTHPDFTTIFTFLIDKNNNHAVDIRDDAGSTRKGTLEISEQYYSLVFPSTEGTDTVSGAWESAVVINRDTNEFKIEWGESPFFEFREENTRHIGLCKTEEYSTTTDKSRKPKSAGGGDKYRRGSPRMGGY